MMERYPPIGFTFTSKRPGDSPIMSSGSWLKEAWEIVPILLLLLVGGAIAIPSGVRRLTSVQGARQLVGNLSAVVLRVLGYVAAMLVLHEWIGLRPGFGW
jgi:hypothetical protein